MIPFFDYRPELQRMETDVQLAIDRVLASGRLILGEEVRRFEEEFSEWVGSPHAVGVNSGTDALILALRACAVGSGDEVLTTSNSGVPTISAIRAVGAVPRFIDVRPDTLLMDTEGLAAQRSDRTRAIVPVHLYGRPVDLGPVLAFAKLHGLRVIEDCAQAHGASYNGRHVGTWGDVGCFSFYPTKNLGAYGDGGLTVTGDSTLAESMREQRMYGFRDGPYAHTEGLNSRLDELQAAILRVKLRSLESSIARRREFATRYQERLGGAPLRIPSIAVADPDTLQAFHLFVVAMQGRDQVREKLAERGVMTGVHYPHAVHRMEAYRRLPAAPPLPVTERACDEVLSLPLYNDMPADTPDRVADELLRALGA